MELASWDAPMELASWDAPMEAAWDAPMEAASSCPWMHACIRSYTTRRMQRIHIRLAHAKNTLPLADEHGQPIEP
eukprot:364668-Chlamydomonas_euryale.AAC.11